MPGSEGGAAQTNASSLPLSIAWRAAGAGLLAFFEEEEAEGGAFAFGIFLIG